MRLQGLILAAGKGRRLGSLLNGKPKGLLTVGGATLIDHQIRAMRSCGIDDICVVVGHGADYVRAAIRHRCVYIENEQYATTNSLYSLWLARNWVKSGFIMVNSDLLADVRIYERLIQAPGSALAYDSTSGRDPEEMKLSISNGRVSEISKSLDVTRSDGESIGLLRFDTAVVPMLMAAADRIVAGGSRNDWSPAAVAAIAETAAIEAIDIAGIPWTEIDFPSDFEYAQSSVWPRMQLARGEGRSGAASRRSGSVPSHAVRRAVAPQDSRP